MAVLDAKVRFSGQHYRNAVLGAWVAETFATDGERAAAWETVRFIRETWPETDTALRGELIGEDEGEYE